MNIWRRGPLTENPYTRTAFHITRLSPEVVRHRTLVLGISQTRNIINADPDAHHLNGTSVTLAAVNAAEPVVLDPRQRILEELLYHATERPHIEEVQRLAAEAVPVRPDGPLSLTNEEPFVEWISVLFEAFRQGTEDAHPSFGALELGMTRPFGDVEPD